MPVKTTKKNQFLRNPPPLVPILLYYPMFIQVRGQGSISDLNVLKSLLHFDVFICRVFKTPGLYVSLLLSCLCTRRGMYHFYINIISQRKKNTTVIDYWILWHSERRKQYSTVSFHFPLARLISTFSVLHLTPYKYKYVMANTSESYPAREEKTFIHYFRPLLSREHYWNNNNNHHHPTKFLFDVFMPQKMPYTAERRKWENGCTYTKRKPLLSLNCVV